MELVLARNPDPESSLPYLLRLPLAGGMVFRVKGTWPRTSAIFCYPAAADEWPAEPDIVERVPLQACVRRGAAIDVVADRAREQRSQIVFTRARGREMVFWQSPRTRKQARPDVRLPTGRTAGIAELEILVDAHERYAYGFPGQQVTTAKRALPSGDYAVELDGRIVASVERKSLEDLSSSLTNGTLRFALTQLATLPRAAVVVEARYSQIFTLEHVRPSVIADAVAELQVRWPSIPIVFCDNRKLAEEWTYRFLGAAYGWALDEIGAADRLGLADHEATGPDAPPPSTAEIRAWALRKGISVPPRGRLRPEVHEQFRAAHS
jgi:ERCC4 domain